MGFVKYEPQGAVAVITIDREKALNALNSEVLEDLDKVIDGVDLETIRCLIITGAGQKSFVAGADIGEMSSLTQAEGEAFGKKGNAVFRKIETLPIPVIAAVNGFALGGGCELSMSCDIRLASENATFGQPEVGLGITAGFGGTQRLARLIPTGKAKEMLYACTNIKAADALSWGLVNAVYPADELMPAALKLAGKIANNAPIAVRNTKKPSMTALKWVWTTQLPLKQNSLADVLNPLTKKKAWLPSWKNVNTNLSRTNKYDFQLKGIFV